MSLPWKPDETHNISLSLYRSWMNMITFFRIYSVHGVKNLMTVLLIYSMHAVTNLRTFSGMHSVHAVTNLMIFLGMFIQCTYNNKSDTIFGTYALCSASINLMIFL